MRPIISNFGAPNYDLYKWLNKCLVLPQFRSLNIKKFFAFPGEV